MTRSSNIKKNAKTALFAPIMVLDVFDKRFWNYSENYSVK